MRCTRCAGCEDVGPDLPIEACEMPCSGEGLVACAAVLLRVDVPASLVPPERVLFCCRTGSFMYNLAVEGSDEDYMAVFVVPPRDLCKLAPPPSRIARHSRQVSAMNVNRFGFCWFRLN